MDPFRDELAAAHAKIAQLEERIRYLEKALQAKVEQHATPQKSFDPNFNPRATPLAWLFVVAACMAAGAGSVWIAGRTAKTIAPTAVSAASFNGIATAVPKDTSDRTPAVVSPGAVASASSKPTSKPPCNCSPGDPLCTCL